MTSNLHIDYDKWRKPKPFGFSGCFRLRNEQQFMAAAIESHLPYLDEAVLIVQPSDDETIMIAEALGDKYDNVRVIYYPLIPDWIGTEGFYRKDPDKPGHLVHMSNYALSQCRYSWIVKAEGDVICLSSFQRIIDAIKQEPNAIRYYGRVILNVAGADCDQFSLDNPRNGGWDEAVFNNDPDHFHFVRAGKWEMVPKHHDICMGWSGIHMKRCKEGNEVSWNGETYLPLTEKNLTHALGLYNSLNPYPANDTTDILFTEDWRKWIINSEL